MSKEDIFSKVPEDRTAVDNILRINHGNQMRLGLMADAKANIMITVSSIVFSVTIANLDNDLSKTPLPAITVFSFNNEILEKFLLNFITTHSNISSLNKTFEPAPITNIFSSLLYIFKNSTKS